MYTAITETIFSDEFVSPELSATLTHLGVTEKVPYKFKIGKDFCIPYTNEFDTEGIYRQMDANLEVTGAMKTIPAYRVKDLERIFSAYSLSKKDVDHYQISMMHGTTLYNATSERMPDVFACLIIQILQQRKINVEDVNDRMLTV